MGKTYPNKKDYEMQRRQHKHEERMAVLEWLKANDENILILGAALGFGASAVTKALGVSDQAANKAAKDGTLPWFTAPGAYQAVTGEGEAAPWFTGLGLYQFATGSTGGGGSKDALLGSVQNSVAGLGNDIASMCLGLLILKNIGPALQGIGEMIPG